MVPVVQRIVRLTKSSVDDLSLTVPTTSIVAVFLLKICKELLHCKVPNIDKNGGIFAYTVELQWLEH